MCLNVCDVTGALVCLKVCDVTRCAGVSERE